MAINAIGVEKGYYPNKLQISKFYHPEKFRKEKFNRDEFTGSKPTVETNSENKKVSFGEGVKLVGKGFLKKAGEMITSVFKHPVRTIAAVGATTLALSALPLIGITAATGAAVLALGFAAFAVGKTAIDVVETVKDNKEGRYDEVRQDLEKIGGDGVDLALALPFVPKAAKQITRFTKYGTSTVGLNTELISNLKNAKNFAQVQTEFAKAETLINYEMIGNEMGLAVKPKLVFKDMKAPGDGRLIGGAYEPTTGELQVNQNILTGKAKVVSKLQKADTESLLRHELEHFRQFSDIARTEGLGIDGLEGSITEYYNAIKAEGSQAVQAVGEQGLPASTIENMTTGDKSVFNRQFYQEVIDSKGTIKAGTSEAEMSAQYAKGLIEKVKPKAEHIAQFEQDTKGITQFTMAFDPMARKKVLLAQMKLYKSNILEKEAYAAQEAFYKANIKMRPGIGAGNAQIVAATTETKKKQA